MRHTSKKQMSESFLTAAFLSISGGLQDAYTYIFRGKVFANAQTGNIVLLSQSITERDYAEIHSLHDSAVIICIWYHHCRTDPLKIPEDQTLSLAAACPFDRDTAPMLCWFSSG